MADEIPKVPDQEELEKELSEYLTKKYGYRIKVVSPMMMAQTRESKSTPKRPSGSEKIQFNLKPEELEAYIDQFVVKQDEAKAILATKISTHYNRIRYQNARTRSKVETMVGRIKNNILLIGPTGVGKTYLIKLIARKLGVPFVKGDATKFSETGYVGGDVEDLVRELLIEADDDLELAQYGIIYIDEIDKIASASNLVGPDVSRTGVQRALLKPMEETDVDLKVAHDPVSQLQAIEQYRKTGKKEKRAINTKNILFIMSGAFTGLSSIVRKRMQKQGMGFGADLSSKDDDLRFTRHVKAEDLIAYGFESEFVGRLPVIAVLESLEVEDLYQILKNRNNPIILGKKEDFRSYGIDIKFEDDALHELSRRAYEEKTGARGLASVIEKGLLSYEKRLPSSEIRYLVVTPRIVLQPEAELEAILNDPGNVEREEEYRKILEEEKRQVRDQMISGKKHYIENYPLVFTPERIELALESYLRTGTPVESVFDEVILLYNQVRVFESDFYEKQGFTIRFEEEAVNQIIEEALHREITAMAVCNEISRDYDYGFKLISDRSGQTQFVLPRRAVVHPDLYLDELIRESYRQYPLNLSELKKES